MSNNKQSMKLYTEEQVRKAIAIGYDWCHLKNMPSDFLIDTFIEELTPIKLPSDEEIESEASDFGKKYRATTYEKSAYVIGAKWMRDKIQDEKTSNN